MTDSFSDINGPNKKNGGMSGEQAFSTTPPPVAMGEDGTVLQITLNNYEGPLELLLDLARNQKVDLKEISLSLLVDQYIEFIELMKKDHIDIAAEYLVMASWLAFLKSKLLLPQTATVDEPPEAMIARRALEMLDAMRQKSIELFARHRRGLNFFLKGSVEELPEKVETRWESDVNKLITAYAEAHNSKPVKQLDILPTKLTSPEMALEKLRHALPFLHDWTILENFLGQLFDNDFDNEVQWRAAYASSFFASLELVRQGLLEIRQSGIFKDLEIRHKTNDTDKNTEENMDGSMDKNMDKNMDKDMESATNAGPRENIAGGLDANPNPEKNINKQSDNRDGGDEKSE